MEINCIKNGTLYTTWEDFKIKEDTFEKLEEISNNEGISLNNMIEKLINDYDLDK
jgi:hypothetical protein